MTVCFRPLCLDLQLFVRLQGSFILGFTAHPLNRVHDVALLRQKSISQIRGPLNIFRQALHDIRKSGHRLNTWIPGLFRDRINQRLVLQPRVVSEPLMELNDLKGIGGSHQRLAQQRVGIQRNGRHERVELVGGINGASWAGASWLGCRRRDWLPPPDWLPPAVAETAAPFRNQPRSAPAPAKAHIVSRQGFVADATEILIVTTLDS